MNRFALILGLGCALGIWNLTRRAGKQQASAALLILGLALLGARTGYVLLHLSYYSQHGFEILFFSAGGLDGPGAMLGGLLGWGLVVFSRRLAFYPALDDLAALFAPLILAIWLGCWLEVVAYGPPLPPTSLLAQFAWAPAGGWETPLWPLPLLAAISLTAAFFGVEKYISPDPKNKNIRQSGRYGGMMICLGMVSLLLVSWLRSDEPAPLWNGLRVDIWESIFLYIITLAVYLSGWLKTEKFFQTISNTERKAL